MVTVIQIVACMGCGMETYFITGATGLIGSTLVRNIILSHKYISGQCQVIVLVRNAERFQEMFCDMDCGAIRIVEGDIGQKAIYSQITEDIDYIIHCAAPTSSAYMVSNPVETADSIVLGTHNILKLAQRKAVKGMVYLSSMEVYGIVPDIGRTRREDELGDIPLDSVRSCYPLAKRMAEHYCYIYAKEYGVPVKIARLAQTFGTGVQTEDNRVYMQFARSVLAQKDIVLKTDGMSMGNYCAIDDVVKAIFLILQIGEEGEVYNVVNESNTMRIKEMARMVTEEIAGGSIRVVVEPEVSDKVVYAPQTNLRLSGEKLRKLGWSPEYSLREMYQQVIRQLNEM